MSVSVAEWLRHRTSDLMIASGVGSNPTLAIWLQIQTYISVDETLAAVCGMCLIAACIKRCILPREMRLCIYLFESTPCYVLYKIQSYIHVYIDCNKGPSDPYLHYYYMEG